MKFDFASIVPVSELSVHLEKVETEMRAALASDNSTIQAGIDHLLQAQGKRLRPSLVLAVASSQGNAIDQKVIAGCVAIELIHLGSLVHDDIIDEAETRWNRSTINAKDGVNSAILVGDYLLAKACKVAASISAEAGQLAATTIAILCEGEAYELADQAALDRTESSLLEAMRCKTASLIAAACQMGGICSGMEPARVAALGRYGEEFGMAFQFVDDVLDFVSTPELLGKSIGNDVREGTYTLPLLRALISPQSERIKHWFSQADRAHADLADIVAQSGAFNETMELANKYNEAAAQALETFDTSNAIIAGLKKLPAEYTKWAAEYMVAPAFQSDL